MKNKTFIIFIGHLALLCFLTGCFNFNKAYPEKHYFVLSVSRGKRPSLPTSNALLKIQRFRVSPRFEGKSFVYRKGKLNYESDFYNEFFIPPGLMVTEEIEKWLAESGLFKYVMGFSRPVEPTFKLEGAVNALYGDYSDTGAPKAVLEIQFFLVRNLSSGPVIVFGKMYHKEILLKGHSPNALVTGWDLALKQILTELETNLKHLDLKEGKAT
jgi:cholesterol transport system auxiliary component